MPEGFRNQPCELTPSTHFVATLSNGDIVVEDGQKGVPHTWLRLVEWLKQHRDVKIVGLALEDSQTQRGVAMPRGQKGYFFANKSAGTYPANGSGKSYRGVGYYDGSAVAVSWYSEPGMKQLHIETKTVEGAGFFLYVNPE